MRASEGAPRDAINVVAKAAAQAGTEPISLPHIRAAARAWYQSDKEAALRNREDVRQLLSWIVDRVIRQQRCRRFLVNQRFANSPLLRILFDARVLHLIKRGYLPRMGGERYDLWVVDYGAYVDLVGTESGRDRILPAELLAGRADPRTLGRSVLDFEEYTQLPPLLDSTPTLDELLPALHATEEFGLQAIWEGRGTLQAPVGILDLPYYQRRETLWLDLSGAAGHVALCGGPQSGKSTLVRTLIASLALTHSPEELGFYCLDCGGGVLGQVAELPHVGSVAARRDVDASRRTVFELVQLVDDREHAFAAHGLDGIGAYRRARRQARAPADGYPTDVFLVIDGWDEVRDDGPIERVVNELVFRGLGFGIHVVIAVSRWQALRKGLLEAFQTTLELRLGNPEDSRVDQAKAEHVPIAYPGSGLSRDGLHMVTALPRLDGVGDGTNLRGGVRDLVARVRRAWNGPAVPPVRLLPLQLSLSELRPPGGDAPDGIPIGLDEERLQPVHLHPDRDPHLAIFGTAESGTSNLLRVIMIGIRERYDPESAKVLLVDYRRSLLDVDHGDHLIGYAGSGRQATTMLAETASELRNRQPGVEVTPEQLRNRS